MPDERLFDQIMQRYNRELRQMQQRTRQGRQPQQQPTTTQLPDTTPTVPRSREQQLELRRACAEQNEYVIPHEAALPPGSEPNPRRTAAQPKPPVHTMHADAQPYSQTVGPNGPVLEQDIMLHEVLESFLYQKPLERPLHVKGYGALGNFRPYQSMRDYTTADFLQDPNQSTPLLVRFSQAGGMRGTPDTVRDIRGFAVRFYTGQGNFDLVGNHIPVFFVRDAMRFPETIAALSPSPVNNLPDSERFWRFIGKTPEAMHMLMWLYSDCGTVDSYRHIEGHGVNTYVWKNKQGVRRYVKYHWLPLAGVRCITRQQALELMSQPNIAGQDLYDTLARGEQVEYELYVQLMNPEQADSLPYDPLDDTKVWDTDAFPMVRVGRITLDRNPEDYRAQVEDVGFSPANLVPGIELSADRMLQGRAFAYWDSQRRRLGPDFREIPVNRFAGWNPQQTLVTSGNGTTVCGELGRSGIEKTDDFTQARKFYANLSDGQQEHLVDNIASELYQTSEATKQAVLPWLETVHADLVQRVQTRMDWYQSHD